MNTAKIDPKLVDKMIELRKSGKTIAEISSAVGVSMKTASNHTKFLGIKGNNGPKINHSRDEEIKRLNAMGYTRDKIRRTLHIDSGTIRRVLGYAEKKETIPDMPPLEDYWKPKQTGRQKLPTEICDGKRYKVVNSLFSSVWEV